MLTTRKSKIASFVVGGLLLAGSVAGVAFADSNTQNTQSTQTQAKTAYYQEFIADFASNLGVSQDQVTAALAATKKQMLQEAVQQGKMTQAQADKIAASKDLGFGMGGFHNNKQGKGNIINNANFLNSAASALGITSDQLKSELQSGKTLQQIITAQNMTMDQFRQKMPQHQRKGNDATSNTPAAGSVSN